MHSIFAMNEDVIINKHTETFDPEFCRDFYVTPPPAAPARSVAEFEQMNGVLVRYPFGISTAIIKEMAEDAIVYTIVANQSQQNTVISQYNNAGVNLANCQFIQAPSDSYWTRDYGPQFTMDGNYEIGVVNFPYNRPRPNDNDIPIAVANFMDVELYGMNVVHTGGNYMSDGMGIAASTTIVYTESQQSGISNAQVNQRMLDYLGIQTYHVVQDPNNTYIDHIDCWGKFLAPDKILIRSVPTSHAQYNAIEQTVSYFASQISSYGTPYKMYRVYTPQNQPYTNSLILNNKVFVPITGSSWDNAAIATYTEAMPGYEIHGFTGSWESTDALHCRAIGVADLGMLYIRHVPILGNAPVNIVYDLTVRINPLSGADLNLANTKLFYQVNGGNYLSVSLTNIGGYEYTAAIPAQPEGSEIHYYIQAEDLSGRIAKHPIMGATDPHIFFVGSPVPPELIYNPQELNVSMSTNGQITELITLSNIGGGVIHYNIQIEDTTDERNLTGSTIDCSATGFTPGETATWTFTVFNGSTDSEWLTDVYIDFPTGVTVNSATNFIGGSGGAMIWDNSTGNGVNVHWHGVDSSNWGVVHGNESATATVNVNISSSFIGDIALSWTIEGDDYGSPPHTLSGEITITSLGEPITWISLNTTEGQIAGGSTHEIIVTFDTNEIGFGTYTCNIIITDDLRNVSVIPVTLTYEANSAGNDIISPQLSLSAYPNPFNPQTKIVFSVPETQFVTLSVYNVKGHKIKTLFQGLVDTTQKTVVWNGTNSKNEAVSSGIYFYRLESNHSAITKKIMLLK
jgi:agmatine/peptidylarginine deiminase